MERGITKGPELMSYLNDLLSDYTDNPPDAVVLGCTHYPFVRNAIDKVFDGRADIYDGGAGTARETLHQLTLHGICAPHNSKRSVVLVNSNRDMMLLEKILLQHMAEEYAGT